MTHQQIADVVSHETGYPVGRSTISAALHRAGEASTAKKYVEEIPWTVRDEHQTHYAPRMLRLLGRRRKGIANSAEMDARLDAWLKQLDESNAVVVYMPDTKDGFFYVHGDGDVEGVPIRREVLVD